MYDPYANTPRATLIPFRPPPVHVEEEFKRSNDFRKEAQLEMQVQRDALEGRTDSGLLPRRESFPQPMSKRTKIFVAVAVIHMVVLWMIAAVLAYNFWYTWTVDHQQYAVLDQLRALSVQSERLLLFSMGNQNPIVRSEHGSSVVEVSAPLSFSAVVLRSNNYFSTSLNSTADGQIVLKRNESILLQSSTADHRTWLNGNLTLEYVDATTWAVSHLYTPRDASHLHVLGHQHSSLRSASSDVLRALYQLRFKDGEFAISRNSSDILQILDGSISMQTELNGGTLWMNRIRFSRDSLFVYNMSLTPLSLTSNATQSPFLISSEGGLVLRTPRTNRSDAGPAYAPPAAPTVVVSTNGLIMNTSKVSWNAPTSWYRVGADDFFLHVTNSTAASGSLATITTFHSTNLSKPLSTLSLSSFVVDVKDVFLTSIHGEEMVLQSPSMDTQLKIGQLKIRSVDSTRVVTVSQEDVPRILMSPGNLIINSSTIVAQRVVVFPRADATTVLGSPAVGYDLTIFAANQTMQTNTTLIDFERSFGRIDSIDTIMMYSSVGSMYMDTLYPLRAVDRHSIRGSVRNITSFSDMQLYWSNSTFHTTTGGVTILVSNRSEALYVQGSQRIVAGWLRLEGQSSVIAGRCMEIDFNRTTIASFASPVLSISAPNISILALQNINLQSENMAARVGSVSVVVQSTFNMTASGGLFVSSPASLFADVNTVDVNSTNFLLKSSRDILFRASNGNRDATFEMLPNGQILISGFVSILNGNVSADASSIRLNSTSAVSVVGSSSVIASSPLIQLSSISASQSSFFTQNASTISISTGALLFNVSAAMTFNDAIFLGQTTSRLSRGAGGYVEFSSAGTPGATLTSPNIMVTSPNLTLEFSSLRVSYVSVSNVPTLQLLNVNSSVSPIALVAGGSSFRIYRQDSLTAQPGGLTSLEGQSACPGCGSGGSLSLHAGDGHSSSSTDSGGHVIVTAGNGTSSAMGGSIYLRAGGNANVAASSGSIYLQAGYSATSRGSVVVESGVFGVFAKSGSAVSSLSVTGTTVDVGTADGNVRITAQGLSLDSPTIRMGANSTVGGTSLYGSLRVIGTSFAIANSSDYADLTSTDALFSLSKKTVYVRSPASPGTSITIGTSNADSSSTPTDSVSIRAATIVLYSQDVSVGARVEVSSTHTYLRVPSGSDVKVSGGNLDVTNGKLREGGLDLIPTNSVIMFKGIACPAGYSELTEGRGRSVFGMPTQASGQWSDYNPQQGTAIPFPPSSTTRSFVVPPQNPVVSVSHTHGSTAVCSTGCFNDLTVSVAVPSFSGSSVAPVVQSSTNSVNVHDIIPGIYLLLCVKS
eukprot:ANDGO_07176.mRNA.1 hypothetical protein